MATFTTVVSKSASANITAQNTFTTPIEMIGNFVVRIRGTWSGTVTLQRSDDAGVTFDDVQVYTANAVDSVFEAEPGILYQIGVKTGQFTSGTVAVRLSR